MVHLEWGTCRVCEPYLKKAGEEQRLCTRHGNGLQRKMMCLFLKPFPETCVKKTGLRELCREPSREVSPEKAGAQGRREKEIFLKISRLENKSV